VLASNFLGVPGNLGDSESYAAPGDFVNQGPIRGYPFEKAIAPPVPSI
jgi:hypothetical protein